MICPRLTLDGFPLVECLEEECAWWDKEEKQCAILSIAKALNSTLKIEGGVYTHPF